MLTEDGKQGGNKSLQERNVSVGQGKFILRRLMSKLIIYSPKADPRTIDWTVRDLVRSFQPVINLFYLFALLQSRFLIPSNYQKQVHYLVIYQIDRSWIMEMIPLPLVNIMNQNLIASCKPQLASAKRTQLPRHELILYVQHKLHECFAFQSRHCDLKMHCIWVTKEDPCIHTIIIKRAEFSVVLSAAVALSTSPCLAVPLQLT